MWFERILRATYGSTSNAFTLQGSGTTGGTGDGFHYVYQPRSGDGQVVALVSSEQKTSTNDKVGVTSPSTLWNL